MAALHKVIGTAQECECNRPTTDSLSGLLVFEKSAEAHLRDADLSACGLYGRRISAVGTTAQKWNFSGMTRANRVTTWLLNAAPSR